MPMEVDFFVLYVRFLVGIISARDLTPAPSRASSASWVSQLESAQLTPETSKPFEGEPGRLLKKRLLVAVAMVVGIFLKRLGKRWRGGWAKAMIRVRVVIGVCAPLFFHHPQHPAPVEHSIKVPGW